MFNMRFEDAFNLAPYNKSLRCYSVIMMDGNERHNVNKGGKIILPPSALDHLTRLHIQYPMLFKLTNKTKNRITHCGVLEFIADEGRCHLPFWMMKNLLANEGDLIQVEYINLRTAKFAKFQPQSVDFLEISNPKAVLENSLRDFATLTKGDTISINYNDKDYEVCVLDTRPDDAVSIIECDLDVDFAPPVGYEESLIKNKKSKATSTSGGADNSKKETNSKPIGYRLDGKAAKSHDNSASSTQATTSTKANQSVGDDNDKPKKGIPFYEYKIGCLRFHHDLDQVTEMETEVQTAKIPEVKGQKLKDIGVKQK